MSDRLKGIAAIVASAFGFALMATMVRLCDDYGPAISCFEKSFFRNIVALIIAAVAFCKAGGGRGAHTAVSSKPPCREQLSLLLIRSVLGTIGIFANFYALSRIPIADGQTLNKTAPFFTIICTWIFLREKASWKQCVTVALAFVGALMVMKPAADGSNAFAYAMGLLGGICAGCAYAAVRALGRRRVPSSTIVFLFSMFSCIASLPFMIGKTVIVTPAQIVILIGAGIGAAIGQFGITLAYRYAEPREIAVFDYTNILFTAAFGYFIFGQISDIISIFGMFVIILAAFRKS